MADAQIEITTVVETNNSEKSLKSLREECGKLSSELDELTIGSDAYNKKLSELATAQKNYEKASNQMKAATMGVGDQLGKMAGVIGATSSAFGAFRSVIGSSVEGGEEVVKVMQKVQTAMAIGQTFSALSGAISGARTAFAALNKTLMANPILAVLAAVVALTAGIVKLISWINSDTKAVDKMVESHNEYTKAMEGNTRAQDLEIRKMQALGASTEDVIKKQIIYTAQLYQAAKAEWEAIQRKIRLAKALGATDEQLEKLNEQLKETKKQMDDYAKSSQKLSDDLEIEKLKKKVEGEKELQRQKDDAAANEKTNRDAAIKQAQAAAQERQKELELIEKNKAAIAEYQKQREYDNSSIETRVELDKERLQNINAEYEALSKTASTSEDYAKLLELEKQRDAVQGTIAANEEAIQNAAAQAATEAQAQAELELQAQLKQLELQDQLAAEQERIQMMYSDRLLSEQELQDKQRERLEQELAGIEATMNSETASLEQRIAAAQAFQQKNAQLYAMDVEAKKKAEAQKKSVQDAAVGALSGALDAASKLTKNNAKAQKAIDIGKATINTFVGATQALASSPPPANFIMMGTTIASGLATVASILKTDVGDGGGGGSVPTIETPSLPKTESEVQEFHNNTTASERAATDNRVYIVESDLSKSEQKRVSLQESVKF